MIPWYWIIAPVLIIGIPLYAVISTICAGHDEEKLYQEADA